MCLCGLTLIRSDTASFFIDNSSQLYVDWLFDILWVDRVIAHHMIDENFIIIYESWVNNIKWSNITQGWSL